MSYDHFAAKSCPLWRFLVDDDHVFQLISLIYNRNVYVTPAMLYTNFVCWCCLMQQVLFMLLSSKKNLNGGKSIMADSYSPRGFVVEYIELKVSSTEQYFKLIAPT